MAGDDKLKAPKKKYDPTKPPQTVGQCFLKFLMTTSVRGVGRIFKTKSRLLMILWTTVVLAFLILSIYQVSEIIRGYFRYDTTQEQRIRIPRKIPFPDITLCNLQPFRRQPHSVPGQISDAELLVLEYFDNVTRRMKEYGKGVTGALDWDRSDAPFHHDAEDPTDKEGAKNNPNFSKYDYFDPGDGEPEEPDVYYDEGDDVQGESLKQQKEIIDRSTLEGILSTTAAIYQNVNHTMRNKIGHEANMIGHCVFTVQSGRRLQTDKCDIRLFKHPQYFNCFTISRDQTKPGTILDLSLDLFLDDEIHLFYPEMYRVDKASQLHGIKVVVHEPGSFPNIGKKGFNVPPGMAANFYLITKRWQNQPPPYGTCSHENADKRIKTWDGKVFRYEKNTCQDQCIQEHINSKCHCVDAELIHPRNNTKGLPFCVGLSTDLGSILRRVACMYDFRLRPPIACLECTLPCHRYDYGTTETMSEWPHESFHLPLYTGIKNKRNITLDELEKIIKTKEEFNLHDPERPSKFNPTKITDSKKTLMDTDSFQRNFVSVTVQKETFEVSIVEEKPDISLAKLLSSVGGIMCFWLGITVITTMEIVELIYDLIMFCFDRRSKEGDKDKTSAEETPINDTNAETATKV
ncbi:FMRFamide-activated amiloride-sensitive sodium channel-like [Lineus longissimus]|uniref:FMRFamide-activated amiloride-sensitive sodium channel-like n=1 Tax=Lineus longissimus TaxID=88925 RepID=UPI00315CA659